MFLMIPNTAVEGQVVGKRVNRKKISAVKNELMY